MLLSFSSEKEKKITMAHTWGVNQQKRGSSTDVQCFTAVDDCCHFAYQDYSLIATRSQHPDDHLPLSKESDTTAATLILTLITGKAGMFFPAFRSSLKKNKQPLKDLSQKDCAHLSKVAFYISDKLTNEVAESQTG